MKDEYQEETTTTPEGTQERVVKKIKHRGKGKKEIEKKGQALKKLSIEYIDIDKVYPNEYNPNRQSEHDFELLLRSMEEDGFTQPIICQRDGVIVDGEHRCRAEKTMGMQTIPVVFVDMTKEQMRIATLRHNRARGSEDVELAVEVLRDLQELGALDWAQDSLMISDVEMNKLLEDVPVPEALMEDEFSEAWEPDSVSEDRELSTEARRVADSIEEGGVAFEAVSSRAKYDIRERERALKEAKTTEEREMIRKDGKIYRLTIIFSGEEANIVKEILTPEPANRILKLCKEEKERITGG